MSRSLMQKTSIPILEGKSFGNQRPGKLSEGRGISVVDCGPKGCTRQPNPNFRRKNTMIHTMLKRFVVGA